MNKCTANTYSELVQIASHIGWMVIEPQSDMYTILFPKKSYFQTPDLESLSKCILFGASPKYDGIKSVLIPCRAFTTHPELVEKNVQVAIKPEVYFDKDGFKYEIDFTHTEGTGHYTQDNPVLFGESDVLSIM